MPLPGAYRALANTAGSAGPRSVREVTDRWLEIAIEAIRACSGSADGVPRVTAWLHKQRFGLPHKRVARLMTRNEREGESGRARMRSTIVDRAGHDPM